MGTWEANAKLCMSHLMVEGSGGTLGAHTVILEARTVLLQALVPSLGVFVLHSAWLGRHDRVNGRAFLSVCVCVFYIVYLCCCVVYIMYSYLSNELNIVVQYCSKIHWSHYTL